MKTHEFEIVYDYLRNVNVNDLLYFYVLAKTNDREAFEQIPTKVRVDAVKEMEWLNYHIDEVFCPNVPEDLTGEMLRDFFKKYINDHIQYDRHTGDAFSYYPFTGLPKNNPEPDNILNNILKGNQPT
jgi:hypothetical protein